MSLKLKHLIVLPGLVMVFTLCLSGCGKKGALTLPDKSKQASHATAFKTQNLTS